MRRSFFKLFAAGLLITLAYVQPVKALERTCFEASADCQIYYEGVPYVNGWPPAMTMWCMTSNNPETAEVMYWEYCYL